MNCTHQRRVDGTCRVCGAREKESSIIVKWLDEEVAKDNLAGMLEALSGSAKEWFRDRHWLFLQERGYVEPDGDDWRLTAAAEVHLS